MVKELNSSFTQHKLRKDLKLQEDPWENYLVHDSQYFLPILFSQKSLSIVDQILLFKFVGISVGNSTIAQYDMKPDILASKYLEFVDSYDEFDDELTLRELIKEAIQRNDDLESLDELSRRVAKMFYLQMKIQGNLRPFKRDYFMNN